MSKKQIIHSYDENNLDIRKFKDRWGSRAEYETVKKVRDRFHDMYEFKRISCPWNDITKDSKVFNRAILGESVYGRNGTDWNVHWNYNLKDWAMIHQYVKNSPNLASGMIFSNVQAFLAEFSENNTGVVATHTLSKDKIPVQILNLAVKNIEGDLRAGMPQVKKENITEMVVLGTNILYNGFIYKARKNMSIFMTGDKIEEKINKLYDDKKWDEINDLRKQVFQDQKDNVVTEDDKTKKKSDNKTMTHVTTKVDYNDVASIHVSLFDFYVDPSATDLQSLQRDATDCVWRRLMSLDQFRTEFENSEDPYILKNNIDRVQSVGDSAAGYERDKAFFTVPQDMEKSKDNVEVIQYYNKITDKFIIVVNDVLLREGPLPYNHKQLPFSVGRFIKFPGLFWGMGMATILEFLQSEDRQLKNLGIKLLERVLRRPTYVDSDIVDDYVLQIDKIESGDIVGIPGGVGNDKISWEPTTPTNVGDIAMWRQSFDSEAVKLTGINPIQYALPDPSQAVRNNVMSLESSQKIMKMSFKSWGWSYAQSILQWMDIMIQMYPLSLLDASEENKETSPKYKRLLVENMEIRKDANGKIIYMDKKDGSPEQEIELTPDLFEVEGQIRFRLDVEAMLPVSQATKISTDKDVLNTLFPIVSNPQLMQNPIIQEMVRKYLEDTGFDPKIMDMFTDDDSNDDIDRAKEQINSILDGIQVPGIVGESPIHLYTQSMALVDMVTQLVAPETSPQDKQKLSTAIGIMRQHVAVDQIPPSQASQATGQLATQALQAQQPPTPPQAPQPPQAGSPQEALLQQAQQQAQAQGQQQMPLNAQNSNMPPQGGM